MGRGQTYSEQVVLKTVIRGQCIHVSSKNDDAEEDVRQNRRQLRQPTRGQVVKDMAATGHPPTEFYYPRPKNVKPATQQLVNLRQF